MVTIPYLLLINMVTIPDLLLINMVTIPYLSLFQKNKTKTDQYVVWSWRKVLFLNIRVIDMIRFLKHKHT
jgi:hypothetical protein